MSYDMNSGYVGWSMSVSAEEAYENGEMPRSKWTKKAMVAFMQGYPDSYDMVLTIDPNKYTKDELFKQFFEYKGWHHTSKFCNETSFYGLDEGVIWEVMRDMTEEEKAEKAARIQREREQRKQEQAEREQRRQERKEKVTAYKLKHGFAPDTVMAFMTAHLDKCDIRISKKGRLIVECTDKHGIRHVYRLEKAANTSTSWFDALTKYEGYYHDEL